MKKAAQIKKNHHYIWRHYLKPWTDGRDIHYTTKTGKFATDSIKGLAVERDFYKINFLDEQDLFYLRRFTSLSPEPLQSIHNQHADYLSYFKDVFIPHFLKACIIILLVT